MMRCCSYCRRRRRLLLASALISIGLLVGVVFLFLSPPVSTQPGSSSSTTSSSLAEVANNVNNGATTIFEDDKRRRRRRWDHYKNNRSIALVHIGKAGGLTLRAMTSLKCRLPRNQVTTESIQSCLLENFGGSSSSGTTDSSLVVDSHHKSHQREPLVFQTIYYAHMRSIPSIEMKAASSWLLVLRNPIDRLISAYQYSHPSNCLDVIELLPNSTKGCINYHLLLMKMKTTQQNKKKQQQQPFQIRKHQQQLTRIFQDCYPQADMETFVQNAINYNNKDNDNDNDDKCSKLARDYIIGRGPIFPIPHLFYNYHHYQTKVLDIYDNTNTNTNNSTTTTTTKKEWFGIRTEHLWDDYISLNRQLGGDPGDDAVDDGEGRGKTTASTNTIMTATATKLTHGSERYRNEKSSKLTQNSYHGLCCLLMDEIIIYLNMIKRIWNFKETTKVLTFLDLAKKCGMLQQQQQQQQSPRLIKKTTSTPEKESPPQKEQVMEEESLSLLSWDQLWTALDTWKETTCK